MGASVCYDEPLVIRRERPLTLRYLLHLHRGDLHRRRADEVARAFAEKRGYTVQRSSAPHSAYEIV
jgi:hypothetical protein